jgi:hypothetical protein
VLHFTFESAQQKVTQIILELQAWTLQRVSGVLVLAAAGSVFLNAFVFE